MQWFTSIGLPADIFFIEQGEDLHCESYMYDGKCDDNEFNEAKFRFDGGDCCASTCIQANCGIEGIRSAFGVEGKGGNGYPNCIDPDMASVTVLLTGIRSSRDRNFLNVTDTQVEEYEREKGLDFWEEDPSPAYFVIDCKDKYHIREFNVLSVYVDNSMENRSEVVKIPEGSSCQISVSNTISSMKDWDNEPIWFVKYTVYHGNDTKYDIVSGDSSRDHLTAFHHIPECYFERLNGILDRGSPYSSNDTSAKSLEWLIEDNKKSGYPTCDGHMFIERAVLSALNFAAPASSASNETTGALWIKMAMHQCSWRNIACDEGSVKTLALTGLDLSGTISTAIGWLSSLQRFYFGT